MGNSYSEHFKKIKSQRTQKKTTKGKQTKSKVSFKAILLSSIGAVTCLVALLIEGEQLNIRLPKIELSFFETSIAKDAETNSPVAENNPQGEVDLDKVENPVSANKNSTSDIEIEDKHLLNLVQRSRELDQREQDVLKLEKEIEEKNKQISERILELKKIREEIALKLKSQVDEDFKKIDQLVEVYSTMRPGQAAKIFEDLDEELAVRVLTRMKKKSAAEILNLMKVEKAKKFTELYTGFDRTPASEKP